MSIESIQALQLNEVRPTTEITGVQRGSGTSFAQWIDGEIAHANSNIQQADQAVQKLALGEADNLHQVMIALDKAQLSFELMVQVRNRMVEGIQEVMRMSI